MIDEKTANLVKKRVYEWLPDLVGTQDQIDEAEKVRIDKAFDLVLLSTAIKFSPDICDELEREILLLIDQKIDRTDAIEWIHDADTNFNFQWVVNEITRPDQ